MSYKIYNHTIQTNETVKSTIKKFRKNDSKPRKPQNTCAQEKEIIRLIYGLIYMNLDKR